MWCSIDEIREAQINLVGHVYQFDDNRPVFRQPLDFEGVTAVVSESS